MECYGEFYAVVDVVGCKILRLSHCKGVCVSFMKSLLKININQNLLLCKSVFNERGFEGRFNHGKI